MSCERSYVLLTPRPASCIFQTADEKDELPGVGDESVLEMLSYSKFSDLEAWLCMPSSLRLPRSLDSSSSSSSSSQTSVRSSSSVPGSGSSARPLNASQRSLCAHSADGDRSSEKVHSFLSPTLVRDPQFLSTPVLTSTPLTSLTPATPLIPGMTSDPLTQSDTSPSGVTVRKRRRLAASPGGLHWNSAGSVQRDFLSPVSPDPSPMATAGVRGGGAVGDRCDRVTLRKTFSVDDQFLQSTPKLKLLSRLERGTRKLRNIHTGGAAGRFDCRKKTLPKVHKKSFCVEFACSPCVCVGFLRQP